MSLSVFTVNVLAREPENKKLSLAVVSKWAKPSRIKPSVIRQMTADDCVNPLQMPTEVESKILSDDDTIVVDAPNNQDPKPEIAPMSIQKMLHIPDRYINNKALFLDVISRVFFPASFIVFNIVFWSLYY